MKGAGGVPFHLEAHLSDPPLDGRALRIPCGEADGWRVRSHFHV